MTTDEYIAKQRQLLQKIVTEDKPLQVAVSTTMAAQSHRIFIEGKNSSGGDIGQYDSTHPFYIDPDYSPRKSPNKAQGIAGLKRAGKTGETKFKNGKPHLTSYQKSYKDFKKNIGQKNDKVRLHLSGDLESDFRNAAINSSAVKPIKLNVHEYVTELKRDENGDKLQGLQKKYGNITNLTKAERALFIKTANFELQKAMSQ